MGVLEGVVIAALVMAGAYVGYHAWEESLTATDDGGSHNVDFAITYAVENNTVGKQYLQILQSVRLF